MFEIVGRRLAVANADAKVLAAADEVLAGSDEDGVAAYLAARFGLTPWRRPPALRSFNACRPPPRAAGGPMLWCPGGSAALDLSRRAAGGPLALPGAALRKVAEAMGGVARAPGYLAGVSELQAFVAAGLAADPPAAGLGEETFPLHVQQQLADVALDLAAEGWSPAEAGDAAVAESLGRDAVYEVLAATAACVAQEEAGRIAVDPAGAAEAAQRAVDFSARCGLGALVRAYAAIATFDDLQAIEFYQPMPEDIFTAGSWHRPWAAHSLRDELLMAAAAGLVRVRRGGEGARQLAVTAEGRRILAEVGGRLRDAGVLAERRRLLAIAHRNALARQPALGSPALPQAWAELLSAAGIRAGSRVLLCGLAAGGDALVREVADVVGAEGAVTVVDPAVAVLRHFARRPTLPAQVRLLAGRFDALPLSDGAVDACLAPSYLHLAEDGRALAEIRRVVRRGGRVALAVPHAVDAGHAVLREWLEPLLQLAARLEVADPFRMHAPGQASQALLSQGFIGVEARPHQVPIAGHAEGALVHLLHGAEAGRGLLERLPWRERHDLVAALSARGGRLVEGLVAAGELVVGTVP